VKDKLMSAANLPFATMSTGLDFVKQVWSNVDVPSGAAGPLAESLTKFITPTLDVAEIDKRLTDLRTVQKWLELNLNILKTTVQTLEVQRGTVAQLARLGLAVDAQGERGSMKELPKMAQGFAQEAGKMLSPQQWWSMMSAPMTELMEQAAKAGAQSVVKSAVKASGKVAGKVAGKAASTAVKTASKAAAPVRAVAQGVAKAASTAKRTATSAAPRKAAAKATPKAPAKRIRAL
jgi:hypothetical protein